MFEVMNDNELLAAQLRKPQGDFGKIVGEKMNEGNAFLYNVVLDCMEVKNEDYILEIGFGNGKFFPQLFSKAENLLVSGLDYSADMVNEAEERNEALISSGRLDVQQGNSDDIPYEDNTFDHVFCINVVYFWDAPAKHFSEIYRVLKPGGKFYAGIRPKEVMQHMPFTQYGFNMYSPEELKALFEKHGFSRVDIHTRQEPRFELNGEIISLQSACVWGELSKS